MIVHEVIGIKNDLISIFVFQQEIVIELLGPIGFKEPAVIVALPGDVKDGTIPDNLVAWQVGHEMR